MGDSSAEVRAEAAGGVPRSRHDTGPSSRHYTAVVCFHGMGQQRHYQSVAEVVDLLERQARAVGTDALGDGVLWESKVRREKGREKQDSKDLDPEVVYVQVDHGTARVRFYEAYWAPDAVEGTTPWGVLGWLFRQIPRPVMVLCAPWRSFARLRRADLMRLYRRAVARGHGREAEGYRHLATRYQGFIDGHGAARSFRAFREHLEDTVKAADDRKVASRLARRWWRYNRGSDVVRAVLLLAIGISIVCAGALLLYVGVWLLASASQHVRILPREILDVLEPGVRPTLANAAYLLVLAAGALGVTRFLTDSVGDVQQFVAYEEVEPLYARRKRILDTAVATLRHVLMDKMCDRVTVVAHSLGTVVALDAILRIRGMNRADHPSGDDTVVMCGPPALRLIHHFITSGSPIDKVSYFFTAFRSKTPGLETLVDELRGDIGSVPFSLPGRQPHVHWVNFWDLGDVISGSLETVAPALVRDQRVDNVRIASYRMPDPASSHGAYFSDPLYVSTLYDVVFHDGLSFVDVPHDADGEPSWPWVGPGTGDWRQTALMALFALVPAVLVIALAAALGFGPRIVVFPAAAAFLLVFLSSAALHAVERRCAALGVRWPWRRGHRR